MRQAQTFDFNFKNVEKQFESYQGINVKLRSVCFYLFLPSCLSLIFRYFIRVSISRRMADVTKEKDIWVHSFRMPPDSNNSIKMEVGIEDCLHIEFEYNKSKFVFCCLFLSIISLNLCGISQISPKGCHCGKDLLPSCTDKDQTYGVVHYSTRNYWFPTKPIQRKRNDHEV